MSLICKLRISIYVILLSLTVGYFLKIYSLPDSNYKIFISILFIVYISISVLFKRVREKFLLFLSLIIFIFECNTVYSAPFWVHLFEAAIKVLSPIIILYFLSNGKQQEVLIKSSICLTFAAHGLLALNIFETPKLFYLMTEKILFLNTEQAGIFLQIIGFLDILACLFLIFNKHKSYSIAVWYCIIWGFITAMARFIYVIDSEMENIIFFGLAEMLVRLPNSMIPFLLLFSKKK